MVGLMLGLVTFSSPSVSFGHICTEGRQGENLLFQVTTLAIYGFP